MGVACLVHVFAPNLSFATAAQCTSAREKFVLAGQGVALRYESHIISAKIYAAAPAGSGLWRSAPFCNRAGKPASAPITSKNGRAVQFIKQIRNQLGAQPLADVWSWHPRSLAPDTSRSPIENHCAAGEARARSGHQNPISPLVLACGSSHRQRKRDGRG